VETVFAYPGVGRLLVYAISRHDLPLMEAVILVVTAIYCIANLAADLTVLFIEHDMNVVFRFASRIIVMVGGRILVEGTPEEIARDERVREVYLGTGQRAAA